MVNHLHRQRTLLAALVLLYALLTYLTYVYFLDALTASLGTPMPPTAMAPWVLGLASAAFVLVVYGLAGLAAMWFARQLGLPALYREAARWHEIVITPLLVGAVAGVLVAISNWLFTTIGNLPAIPHPGFPLSIIASLTAGIGEEILFRGLVFGLWAYLLNLLLRRWRLTTLALWIANGIAALAFAAAHLPAVMVLYDVTTPADLPALLLAEIFLLNILIALPAGWQAMRNGLVAAMGVHFWADVVWHVIWPLLQ